MTEAFIEPEETAQLLSGIAAGNRQSWTRLLEMHKPYLTRVLSHRMDARMAARVDVDDIIQETHMQAAKRIDDYLARRPMPFRLWLRKTACECMLQLRRKHVEAQARTVTRESPVSNRSSGVLAEQLLAKTTSPSGKFIKQETGRQVRAAVDLLAEQDRDILLLRTYEGLSNAEASCVLEIAADACRKRYTRALMRLRDVLAECGLSEFY